MAKALFTAKQKDCILCQCEIKTTDETSVILSGGWDAFMTQVEEWETFGLDPDHRYFSFSTVRSRLVTDPEVHRSCRTNFRTLIKRRPQPSMVVTAVPNIPVDDDASPALLTRSSSQHLTVKHLCFICNEKRECDDNKFKEGGLGRCQETRSKTRLLNALDIASANPGGAMDAAINRLQILLAGSQDIFAVDVYYHFSCYGKFTYHFRSPEEQKENESAIIKDVWSQFFLLVKQRILRDHDAFFLHELLTDVRNISIEFGLKESVEKHTVNMRRLLEDEFGDKLCFFNTNKHVIVHSAMINPMMYSVRQMAGNCMRKTEVYRMTGQFLSKLPSDGGGDVTQMTADELTKADRSSPLSVALYNVVYCSIFPKKKLHTNEHGFATTKSVSVANKIQAIAHDWEALMTRRNTVKQCLLGLSIHRITGSKEAMRILHKSGHSISYLAVLKMRKLWATSSPLHARGIASLLNPSLPIHATIDNNDGRQEGITGTETTHDTNCTVFQPGGGNYQPGEFVTSPKQQHIEGVYITGDNPLVPRATQAQLPVQEGNWSDEIFDDFHIGITKPPPPRFPIDYKDSDDTSLLDACLQKDLAWAMANGVEEPDLPLLGSWTPFQRHVSGRTLPKSLIQYLPVLDRPPDVTVCKHYLDTLEAIADECGVSHIFVHADEDVYKKLCQIIWKTEGYKRIFEIMGGFHQMLVRQKLIHKRHGCKSYDKWFVDAGVIAAGSVAQAWEGRHYYRFMRVAKEAFDALVQTRVETLTKDYSKIDDVLLQSLRSLRLNPSTEALSELMELESFRILTAQILKSSGTECQLTVAFLKDVSSLLALVSAVREGDFKRHLQAERELIFQAFAFGHPNYARSGTYQHLFLQNLPPEVEKSLVDHGFGATYSGDRFTAQHGDLVTERFNAECKGAAGPFHGGYSTSKKTVNDWTSTLHHFATVRESVKHKLQILTSSNHKETGNAAKMRHCKHVQMLKLKLKEYNVDPFGDCPAKELATGVVLDTKVVNAMLTAPEVGKAQYAAFVKGRLVEGGDELFFAPIKRLNLPTGLSKKPKVKAAVKVAAEERQGFGLLLAKDVDISEAFKHPVTPLPFSLANPDGSLRQTEKASFRNFLVNEAQALTTSYPPKAAWIYDGMALMRRIPPKETYGEWLSEVLRNMIPEDPKATAIIMANDEYFEHSVKQGTRNSRSASAAYQRRVSVTGAGQRMPQGREWADFFALNENKTDLIKLTFTFLKEQVPLMTTLPFWLTIDGQVWDIQAGTPLFRINHEEADTMMPLLASKATSPVVVVSKDTDVQKLLVYAYGSLKVTVPWSMKIETSRFVQISAIAQFLGPLLCDVLPAFHALTGCDTTSYFYRVGKVATWKRMVKTPSTIKLLTELGADTFSPEVFDAATRFVQLNMYPGLAEETYLETRIRLYKKMKRKSSLVLPPDPDSLKEAIRRVFLQTNVFRQCLKEQMVYLEIEEHGWQVRDGQVKPVWYTGPQLPKCMKEPAGKSSSTSPRKRVIMHDTTPVVKKRRKTESNVTTSEQSDVDDEETGSVYFSTPAGSVCSTPDDSSSE